MWTWFCAGAFVASLAIAIVAGVICARRRAARGRVLGTKFDCFDSCRKVYEAVDLVATTKVNIQLDVPYDWTQHLVVKMWSEHGESRAPYTFRLMRPAEIDAEWWKRVEILASHYFGKRLVMAGDPLRRISPIPNRSGLRLRENLERVIWPDGGGGFVIATSQFRPEAEVVWKGSGGARFTTRIYVTASGRLAIGLAGLTATQYEFVTSEVARLRLATSVDPRSNEAECDLVAPHKAYSLLLKAVTECEANICWFHKDDGTTN